VAEAIKTTVNAGTVSSKAAVELISESVPSAKPIVSGLPEHKVGAAEAAKHIFAGPACKPVAGASAAQDVVPGPSSKCHSSDQVVGPQATIHRGPPEQVVSAFVHQAFDVPLDQIAFADLAVV
jgi:hypothetical protein